MGGGGYVGSCPGTGRLTVGGWAGGKCRRRGGSSPVGVGESEVLVSLVKLARSLKVGKVGGVGEKGALRKVLNVGGGDPQVLCRACVEDLWPFKEAAVPVCVDGAQSACGVKDCVVEANHRHWEGVSEGRGAVVWGKSVLVVALGR